MPTGGRWLVPLFALALVVGILSRGSADDTNPALPLEDLASRSEPEPAIEAPVVLVDVSDALGEGDTPAPPSAAPARQTLSEPTEPPPDEEPEVPATTSPDRLHARLFEHPLDHADAPGHIWELGPGLTTAGFAFDNDSASAALVPPGVTLTLFVDGEGNGRRVVLPPGRHDLHAIGFGDEVSSVQVSRAGHFDPATPRGPGDSVRLHQHLPREGELGEAWNLRLRKGQTTRLFRAADGHFLNNEASAAWIPPGYEVTLFENGNGLGQALVLGPGFYELLPFDFNDRTSSARVRRVP